MGLTKPLLNRKLLGGWVPVMLGGRIVARAAGTDGADGDLDVMDMSDVGLDTLADAMAAAEALDGGEVAPAPTVAAAAEAEICYEGGGERLLVDFELCVERAAGRRAEEKRGYGTLDLNIDPGEAMLLTFTRLMLLSQRTQLTPM